MSGWISIFDTPLEDMEKKIKSIEDHREKEVKE